MSKMAHVTDVISCCQQRCNALSLVPQPSHQSRQYRFSVPSIVSHVVPYLCNALCAGESVPDVAVSKFGLTWEQLVEDVKPMPDVATWKNINPSFYICFWTLTYADIHFPASMSARQPS